MRDHGSYETRKALRRKNMSDCDQCAYYYYDEDYEDYLCSADIDEDDYDELPEVKQNPAGKKISSQDAPEIKD